MADLEQTTREVDRTALDIDEVAADTLEMPTLSAPALSLADLDQALNHPGILSPGLEWRRLDAGSYALRLPGMDRDVRVTTRAEVFDDHFESHQFLSPGGQLFERIASECLATDGEIGKPLGDGKVWLLVDCSTGSSRFLVRRRGELMGCNSLADILEAVDDDSMPGPLDATRMMPNEAAYLLA